MATPHYIWRKIGECTEPQELTWGYWRYLQRVAERITTIDFSGKKTELADKLLYALGYKNWDQLKDGCSLEDNIDILVNLGKEAEEKYDGKMDTLFAKGSDIVKNKKELKQTAHRIRRPLGIYFKRPNKKTDILQLNELVKEIPNHEVPEPLIDRYMWKKTKARISKKLTDTRKRKLMDKT
jgi:hypothetical protein